MKVLHGARVVRALTAALLAATLALVTAGIAVAHEERRVGEYDFVVGFIDEPVFVGQKSGLELLVTRDGEPVEGLEETLQAEVTKDGERRDLPLSPRFGEPGWYQSYFFPTAAGSYTFRIFGTIEGEDVDESFSSSPEGFDEVQAATSGQFPVVFPPTSDLANQAQRGADAASLMPLAIGMGALGLLAGLVALGMSLGARRRPA
jgi:hypothetical protein